jgi:hypothetical protein
VHSRLLALAAVPLAALALFALPVAAEEPEDAEVCRGLSEEEDAPEICEVRYYLQCDGTTAGKLAILPPLLSPTPEFTEDAPTGSFTEGEGCGQAEDQVFRNTVQDGLYSFDFKGIADGNIDSLTIELHDFAFFADRFADELDIQLRLSIEGASPFGYETIQNVSGDDFHTPKIVPVTLTPELSETAATVMYRFTVTGLDDVLGTASGSLPDHEIIVTVDIPTDGVSGFVWGADEIPSGLTINPLEPAETVIEATGGN